MPPRLARLLAILAAVAMVAAALWWRGRGDDGAEGSSGTEGDPGAAVRIGCAAELPTTCELLAGSGQVTVEPTGVLADRLAADGPPPFDVWVTVDPFPAMVEVERDLATLPPRFDADALATAPVVASSPLALLVPESRRAALEETCRAPLGWTCVGDQVGSLDVGMGTEDDAVGVLAAAQALAAKVGTIDFGLDELRDNARWLGSLERSAPPDRSRDQVAELVGTGAASYDLVATTTGTAERAAASAQGTALRLRAVGTEPAMAVTAVVVGVDGTSGPAAVGRIAERLRSEAGEVALRTDGLPPTTRRPASGTMVAPDLLVAIRQELSR